MRFSRLVIAAALLASAQFASSGLHAMPGASLTARTLEKVATAQPTFRTIGMYCERTLRNGRWGKRCRSSNWSPGFLADLRPHPNLRPRCWQNRWGYAYCPDARLWDLRKINRRCRIDGIGNLHCPDSRY